MNEQERTTLTATSCLIGALFESLLANGTISDIELKKICAKAKSQLHDVPDGPQLVDVFHAWLFENGAKEERLLSPEKG
jgi:hypothetical protein